MKTEPFVQQAAAVHPTNFVTIKLFAQMSGFTEKAVRRKIEKGDFIEGHEFVRARGTILMSLSGYAQWAQGLPRVPHSAPDASGSPPVASRSEPASHRRQSTP
jgi:hypothetical protein